MVSPAAEAQPLAFLELVEPSRWQRLQEHFAVVLGITIRTVSPARELLVTPSWPLGLSADLAVRWLKIGEELESLLPLQNPPQHPTSLATTLGVTYAIVPIRATHNQTLAYFVIGPMVVGPREDELQFRQRMSRMGLDAQVMWPIFLSLKLYTFSGIRSVLNLLEEVGSALVQFGYQAKKLATILPTNGKGRVDQAVVRYYTDRVLHSLLDAATMATRAEGGSVMVYDRGSDALKIEVAQGLSADIVTQTRLKHGEGLAGLAMAENRVLLVDEQTTDTRLKSRMRRADLRSSLVAPLLADATQEAFGVLNLRTSNPAQRFTREHVELLGRLLDLAGVALGSLRVAFTPAPPPSA